MPLSRELNDAFLSVGSFHTALLYAFKLSVFPFFYNSMPRSDCSAFDGVNPNQPFKRQFHKMVKHIQTICRQIADEFFECVWPFC